MGCGASTAASGGVAAAPQTSNEKPVQQAPVEAAPAPAQPAPAAPASAAEQPAPVSAGEQPAPAPVSAGEQPAPAPVSAGEQPAPAPVSAGEQPAPAPVSAGEQPASAPVSAGEQPAPAPAAARPTGAFPATKSAKGTDWAPIKAKLPWDQTEESKAARKALFSQFDINHSGQLSLGEVDKAIRDVLQIDDLFDAKPVIIRAFDHVKRLDGGKGKGDADSVSFAEFRMLLQFLFHFFVWEFFCGLDQDGDEGRISAAEFKAAVPALKALGVEVADADAEFASVAKGSNHILFGDFADYALAHNLQHVIVMDE